MHFVQVKGLLSAQNGMNLYRGCSHGCIYCDSRSACYHMDHAFEDIEVKENAIELLEQALRRKRTRCMLGTGAMTDPYIPLEEETGNVRKALLLVRQYGFGITLHTKSTRVLRDLDLLRDIHERGRCVVQMTLTTHSEDLCRKLEPNVSTTRERVEAAPQRGHPHRCVAEPDPSVYQRYRGEYSGYPEQLRRGGGLWRDLLRDGAYPPGGEPGILLQAAGPAFPGDEGAVYQDLRDAL